MDFKHFIVQAAITVVHSLVKSPNHIIDLKSGLLLLRDAIEAVYPGE